MSTTISCHWTALVTGPLLEELDESLNDVVTELAAIPNQEHDSDSHIGMALLFGYLYKARGNQAHAERARQHIEKLFTLAATVDMPPTMFDGYIGIAWTVDHLRGLLFGDADDTNEAIDDELCVVLDRPWLMPSYDLINGLVGAGVYAYDRLPRERARAALETIVIRLRERATWDDEGLRWWTSPNILPEFQRNMAPNGYCNLGIAHGIPGILWLLARTAAMGIGLPESRVMADATGDWLIKQRLPAGSESNFLHWCAPDLCESPSSRAAWCYGDPGVVVALLDAARQLGRHDWEAVALEIIDSIAARSVEAVRAIDAGLCHGTVGLAHLLNRFHQATRKPELAAAARAWYERTLRIRRHDEGVAGYAAWTADTPGSHPYWKRETDLLTGAAGVALALLAATTTVEPSWDRLLIASLPPVPERK